MNKYNLYKQELKDLFRTMGVSDYIIITKQENIRKDKTYQFYYKQSKQVYTNYNMNKKL